jgi:hypothetical protein
VPKDCENSVNPDLSNDATSGSINECDSICNEENDFDENTFNFNFNEVNRNINTKMDTSKLENSENVDSTSDQSRF